jgi:predicted NAD/FAD-binding protein
VRIAIVGTGVAGLVCAHLLHRRHEIEVFEAAERIGGHVHTVDVEIEGERRSIDTGFIVYNEITYPLFSALLRKLGVPGRPTNMSFGVSCERSGREWASHGVRSIFAQPSNLLRPSFRRMLREILRFNHEARLLLERDEEKVALGDWLLAAGYSNGFVDHYVVPMGAAVWSTCPGDFLRFPATSFVRFFANHHLLQRSPDLPWRVVQGGSRRYVDALVRPFRDRIETGHPVRAIRRIPGGVELVDGRGRPRRYDRAVLAAHSDQALGLLGDASPAERQILGAVRFQRNDVALHTDTSVMPRSRRAWAAWNYRVRGGADERPFVTYHMNRLQGFDSRHDLFVTLNGGDRVAPESVLAEFAYDHPVFDAEAMRAQRLHHVIDGVGGTHFCGAWWGWGFHEDGVQSAVRVCEKLGAGWAQR